MGNWFRPNINFVSISSYFWRNNLLLLLQKERERAIVVGGQIIASWSAADDQDDQEVCCRRRAPSWSPSGPHKNWKLKPNRLRNEKRKSSPLNSHLGCQSFWLIFRLGQRVWSSVWYGHWYGCSYLLASTTRPTTPVDGFQWRLIWFWKQRAEFKWNLARCAKTKTAFLFCFKGTETLLRHLRGNTLVSTQSHTLHVEDQLNLPTLVALSDPLRSARRFDCLRSPPTLIVIWVACKLIPLIC